MASLVVSALSTWSNKGLKKAEKDVSAFDKTVKNLGKTFAGVFAASTIINYSKNAVKAFMDDEKAAKSLAVQLNNVGLGFAAPGIELYINNLQRMTGVLDDQLRPAFQTLVTATGDLTLSQNALDTALNVSAATGASLESVSKALARGFTGQTTALSRLGAGLDKTLLATGDMEKIMAKLNEKFSGQAKARLSTYAGQMSLLQVYAADAQETIGKGLLDAIKILGEDNSIQNVGDSMQNLADNISNVTTNLAKMIKTMGDIASNPAFQAVVALLLLRAGRVDLLAKVFAGAALGSVLTADGKPTDREDAREIERKLMADRNKEARLLKTSNNLRTLENEQLKKKTEVDKLNEKFNVERIGLMTALNAATDEETKLRLKAQLAILDNNSALAAKYNAELGATASLKTLMEAFNGAALTTKSTFADIEAYIKRRAQLEAAGVTVTTPPEVQTIITQGLVKEADRIVNESVPNFLEKLRTTVKPGYEIPSVESFYGALGGDVNSMRGTTVNNKVELTLNGALVYQDQLDEVVQNAMLRAQRANGALNPAGYLQ
jgi:hypothetical protein